MRARIDPSTRVVLEEATPLGVARADDSAPPGCFVELAARTTFTGVTIEGSGATEGRTLHDARAAWPGAGQPEELVARAALFGQDTIAITDVDTVAGVVRAHVAGQELGVSVIPGVELSLDEGSLTLLPMTARGWQNLCAILTIAKDGALARGVCKDDIEHRLAVVLAHHDDLIVIAWPPFRDDALAALAATFGDRLSAGLAFTHTPDDAVAIAFARRACARGVSTVLSARPLLVDEEDGPLLDVLCCIRQHLTLARSGQRLPPNRRARLLHEAELVALATARLRDHDDDRDPDRDQDRDRPWGAVAEMIARSRAIAARCAFRLDELRYTFPLPRDHDDRVIDADRALRARTIAGARERYDGVIPDDVARQLEHELALVKDIGVASYFLTVKDIVDVARERGILCQGRGSAANSAICYCLGITSIDPVRMGLLFERFLSRERAEPPDIDVDFEHERREEVIQEIYRRWGRTHAAMVCEVIAYRGRSAVREVGKVFGLSEVVTGALADLMHHGSFRELLGVRGQSGAPRAFVDVAREVGVDATDPAVIDTLRLAARLQGHPRHLGVHVGGFVLTHAPITSLVPVEPARMPGRAILPFDKDDVDALGLFKMDVLGLGMLTCIRKAIDLVATDEGARSSKTGAPPPTRLSLARIPAEDPVVYDAICAADTVGVFQIESRAQMAMLPRLKPRSFYDLVVQVAIIRPGPIQGGMVHPYLRRRGGQETIDYPHERLRPILERTLGVPLFQEQVMKLAVVGAGYTPGEADQLRRDMAAWKKTGRLERHRERLFRGFTASGVDADFAHRLYEQIKGFGEYGFPESHAASFAILVYASSWLKTHYPAHFACALINSLPMGFYAPAQIVADAQRHGVEVRSPCAQASDWDCVLEPPPIAGAPPPLRLGLRLVKGLREEAGRAIAAARGQGGAYVDVGDVVARARLDKRARVALAKAGAFDALAPHRRAALWAALDPRPPLLARLPDAQAPLFPPTEGEVLALDYATVGLSIDDHPLRYVRPAIVARLARRARGRGRPPPLLDSEGVLRARHGTRALVCGLVIGRQRPGTADGTCFITLEDERGMTNVVVWGRDFERQRAVIVGHSFLLVDAVIEREGTVVHAIARSVVGVVPPAGAFDGSPAAQANAPTQLSFPSRDFH